jgi:hypothetical protein
MQTIFRVHHEDPLVRESEGEGRHECQSRVHTRLSSFFAASLRDRLSD